VSKAVAILRDINSLQRDTGSRGARTISRPVASVKDFPEAVHPGHGEIIQKIPAPSPRRGGCKCTAAIGIKLIGIKIPVIGDAGLKVIVYNPVSI
jgi:hypothetical protein